MKRRKGRRIEVSAGGEKWREGEIVAGEEETTNDDILMGGEIEETCEKAGF